MNFFFSAMIGGGIFLSCTLGQSEGLGKIQEAIVKQQRPRCEQTGNLSRFKIVLRLGAKGLCLLLSNGGATLIYAVTYDSPASALLSTDGNTWQSSLSLSDGVYAISFRSTDNAGNTATATRLAKVDASLPTILTSISGTEGNSGWYVSRATTTITADELSGIDHIEYNQNGTGWQEGSSFISREGTNLIDIQVYDIAGNVASKSLEINVDTTPPSLSTAISGTDGLADWYLSETETTISASDNNSGVNRVEYSQNSTGWQDGSSVKSSDGVNTIEIRAYDVAGNASTDTLKVKVDTVTPIVEPIVPIPDGLNGWFITGPVAVSVTGSDSGSGLANPSLLSF